MTALQKYAWYNLGVISVSCLGAAFSYPALGERAIGWFGLLGFLVLSPFLFRKKAGLVCFDERDRLIQIRSTTVAYAIYWVCFTQVAVFGSVAVYGRNGSVPVKVVILSVCLAVILFLTVQSIVILIQYSRDAKGEA